MGLAESHGFFLLCTSLFMQRKKLIHLTSSILHGQDWNTSPQNNKLEKKSHDRYLANLPARVWHMEDKAFVVSRYNPSLSLWCGWGNYFSSVPWTAENSYVTQHLHHGEPFNITNVTKKKWISIRKLNWAQQHNIKSILFYNLNTSFRADSPPFRSDTHPNTQPHPE